MKKQLVLDFDGVLYDSLSAGRKAVNESITVFGIPAFPDDDSFRAIYSQNYNDFLRSYNLSDDDIRVHNKLFEIAFNRYTQEARLYDEVPELLDALSEDFHMRIVSSNMEHIINRVLDQAGIDCFEEIMGFETSPSKVDKLEVICEECNQKPGDILFVTDSVGDIIESQEAGVPVIAVTWGFQSKKDLQKADPDYIVDSFEELIQLFAELY